VGSNPTLSAISFSFSNPSLPLVSGQWRFAPPELPARQPAPGEDKLPNMVSLKRSRRSGSAVVLLVGVAALSLFTVTISAQRRKPAKHGTICGNPTIKCRTSATFPENDLPFQIPSNANIYDTDLFYAIILKSVNVAADNCERFVPEGERLAAQAIFPDHKVFSSRCADPGGLFYTNTSSKTRFMAVYAGMSLTDANKMLAAVKASGKYPGANIRRMRAGFNGT
jgi:hypothetical protein